jgi:thiamine-phosphate pyrophosphorylase
MVTKLRGLKKPIYLISPNKIYQNFYSDLDKVLSSKKVSFFQLRLKNLPDNEIIKIGNKIKPITKKHKVFFLINDSYKIAKKIKADGSHLGQKDGLATNAFKLLGNKIIGITCHNSKVFADKAIKDNATYLAFGSFFKSKLKPNAIKANLRILSWVKKKTKKPIVAIGGINEKNYKKLINAGANFVAISSFIWNNPFLKPELAIKKFN